MKGGGAIPEQSEPEYKKTDYVPRSGEHSSAGREREKRSPPG